MNFKEKAKKILEYYDEYTWRKDLNDLTPKDRLKTLIEIAEFVEPKLQRQEIKSDSNEITIKIIRE
jgi:poly-beta-hydroxyalkanoate depolymerase